MTANSLVEGYSEYLVGAVPSSFRSPASLIETMRRRDIDHNQDCKGIVSQNIIDFLHIHSALLTSTNIRILELNDDICSFINQDRPFGASEFLRPASILKRFGTFDSILK
jgi:hypothetical protein